ncbi:MAG: hypothetical protein R3349_11355, partial [Geminicoccaceae bacterium]|nr:hypothetical protein [Geminicoccaceae bacterium]
STPSGQAAVARTGTASALPSAGPPKPLLASRAPSGDQPAPARLSAPSGAAKAVVEVAAEVGGTDPAGRVLLRLGDRVLRVQEPLHLPKGARVRLAMTSPDAAALDRDGPKPPAGPSSAGSTASAASPRPLTPDAGLAVRLLDLAGRLGAAAERAASFELTSDPARPQVVQARDQPGGFRVVEVPFGVEPDLARLRLHVRDDPADDPGEPSTGGGRDPNDRIKRAIVALDLERLGPCQLDVLCHGRRFDLRLRSERPLPEDVRLGALGLYLAARDAAGLEGEMAFAPGELLVFEPSASAGTLCDA